ncbi:sulfatase-like hydrolase/transferase [Gammaproteobacteria bacterium]|nr:sulfatase-like hydrolase/transferase [Gammaproteobacteria bacterium]
MTQIVLNRENSTWIILAPAMVFVFPFVSLVSHHQYGLLNPEVGVIFASSFVVGLVLGCLHLSHVIIRTVFLSLWITISFVAQLNLSLPYSLALLVSLITVGIVIRRSYSTVAFVFFLTLSVVSVIKGSDNEFVSHEVVSNNPDLPAYIHIVLDGHIGIGGIPPEVPGSAEFRQEYTNFLEQNGFSMFTGAYSQYIATINSLRNLFNFTSNNTNVFFDQGDAKTVSSTLDRPLYFKILHDQGYALRIFHPQYLDYCSANRDWVSYCHRYPNINLQSIENSDFTTIEKATLMMQTLLKQSVLIEGYYHSLKWRFGLPALKARQVPGVNQNLIDVLANDIEHHARGYAYIAHLLAPHAPFVYDSECILQTQRTYDEIQAKDPAVTWKLVDDKIRVIRPPGFQKTRALRYGHYFEQIRCITKWLAQLFSALETANAYDDATIILHSDHGSKIGSLSARTLWQHEMTTADYIDTYSSLFAVKHARTKPQINDSFLSLQEILADVVENEFSIPLDTFQGPPFVYMLSDDHPTVLDKKPVKNFINSRQQ